MKIGRNGFGNGAYMSVKSTLHYKTLVIPVKTGIHLFFVGAGFIPDLSLIFHFPPLVGWLRDGSKFALIPMVIVGTF